MHNQSWRTEPASQGRTELDKAQCTSREDLSSAIGAIWFNCHMENTSPNNYRMLIFSRTQRTFTKIDHKMGHQISLNKLPETKILQGMFSEYMEY